MKIVEYDRVSTKKQGKSGLGLAAQRKIIADYAKNTGATIIAKYREVETGRNNGRPMLIEALAHARSARAILVIAKLDRLSRDVEFIANVLNSGVEFVCCDMPMANRQNIQQSAIFAEYESLMASRRTKDALAAAKRDGAKLGSARPGHWEGREHLRGYKEGAKQSAIVRSDRARTMYSFLMPKIEDMRYKRKMSYEAIANALNDEGHQTTVGKPFTSVSVFRLIDRYSKQPA